MAALPVCSWLVVALALARVMITLGLSRAQSLTVARHREAVPEAFAQVLTLAAHHRAADYTRAKENLSRRAAVWDGLIFIAWTVGGGLVALDSAMGTWMQQVGVHLGPSWHQPLSAALLLVAYSSISWLLDVPFVLWSIFVIEQRFGFNRTTWPLFIKDQLKGALLGMVLGVPLWLVIVTLLEEPKPWAWLWAWGAYSTLMLLLVWAGPKFIAPLFNTFRPLEDDLVRQRIATLMQRCGYGRGSVYVMDGSARSTHGNAYFTGLGKNKRVVFFDTLLQTLQPDEIEGVLAHELGHFALGHIQKQLAVSIALAALIFYALGRALFEDALFAAVNMETLTVPARLLALMMLASLVSFLATPCRAYLSRRREYEADAYASRFASAQALQRALLKLFVDNGATLTPNPSYAAFYSSHPPAVQRLGALQNIDARKP